MTRVEGEWDEVMDVVKRAVLKADIRPGHTGQITAKVERLEQHLDH
jgi:uncharacterized protein YqgV (UPF0045/DUF77 family)